MVRGKSSWIQDEILRVSSHSEEEEPHRLVDIIIGHGMIGDINCSLP